MSILIANTSDRQIIPFQSSQTFSDDSQSAGPWLEGSSAYTDLDESAPYRIEQALREVRAEAEEERLLDQDLDPIPDTAYEDVGQFFKTLNELISGAFTRVIPQPDIMPLDNGEICLEWRAKQKIFTLSFSGDGHIVFAGIFSEENRARGILTFSMPHLIAILSMITSLNLYYEY